MGLLSKSQLSWFGASYEAVTGSTVRSVASGLIARGLDGPDSCLVPALMGLPLVPSSVGWHWDKGLLQSLQLGPQTMSLLLSGY